MVFVHPAQGEKKNPPLSREFVGYVLSAIFDPGPVLDFLVKTHAAEDGQFDTINNLIGSLRSFFAKNLQEDLSSTALGNQNKDLIRQTTNLANFERDLVKDMSRFETEGKPKPSAVYWPNPERATGESLFKTSPYVETIDLIKKSTPIGSAGSCFASEIAYYLQNHKYNYVITETHPSDGQFPESSARWGIIFNTPSFKQLVEKAFGHREMPKLAEFHVGGNYWQDPFRENIAYDSVEELDADRETHIKACRDAFLECEVFIVTLGLNECWEFIPDGTVSSRNPKTSLHYALFRHRVLTIEENTENLQAFLDVLRSYNPNVQVIVTVSPVPFIATGLAAKTHVVTANMHSKAVLRVAAENFVSANDGVHYFPSFEMVMHCLKNPWEADQRHIKSSAIKQIMNLFEEMYTAKLKDG